ncbi:hypothetical protein C0993_008751 [Termitomyces sp. T159_Od127]|nr:hypothetical protein C0993_008751 [Termitomyces sp. T159_Od127]
MALSVSGFPEPLRQLDNDDAALSALQRGLSLFAKKRQNTEEPVPPDASPISPTDEFAKMSILQPPPMDTVPPSHHIPRQVSLSRAQQRRPSIGRLEIGHRPSLPKPPQQDTQPPLVGHPRPLPVVPNPASQGPIIESSKSAALRAAAQNAPRAPASRNAIPGPSRPRAATTGPQNPRTHPLTLDPTASSGASSSPSTSTPVPTPAASTPTSAPSGPRPLPRIPPVSSGQISPPTPIPAAAGASSYVPRPSREKRPKTSPTSSTIRSPYDASSWASRPVDLNPSGPSTSNVHASASSGLSLSGSNAHASGSGSSALASGSSSQPRSLPRPRSHSRTRDQSVEASGPRSRGAASPLRRAPLATGSLTTPLPSSPGSTSTSVPIPSSNPIFTTPPGSRRTSAVTSNPPTPRSSMHTGAVASPRTSPQVPSFPSPKLIRALPPTATAKIVEGPAIARVSTMTFTASAPTSPAFSTFTAATTSASLSIPADPSAHPTPRSHSVSHSPSILKSAGTRARPPNRTRTLQLQLHTPPPKIPNSPLQQRSLPSEKPCRTDPTADANADASADADRSKSIICDADSFISRSPSPIRYAPYEGFQSYLSDDEDGDAHPDHRSRPRNRLQLHAYRPEQAERSPSPIAYAKRSSVDVGDPWGGTVGGMDGEEYDDDDDDELGFGDGMQRLRRHAQPRSYQCKYTGPLPPLQPGDMGTSAKEKEKESIWRDLLGRKDGQEDGKDTKDGGGLAWNTFASNIVRRRSKSKNLASQSQAVSRRGSVSGSTPTLTTGTKTRTINKSASRQRGSILDISPPTTAHRGAANYSNSSLVGSEEGTAFSHDSSSRASTGTSTGGSTESKRRRRHR